MHGDVRKQHCLTEVIVIYFESQLMSQELYYRDARWMLCKGDAAELSCPESLFLFPGYLLVKDTQQTVIKKIKKGLDYDD